LPGRTLGLGFLLQRMQELKALNLILASALDALDNPVHSIIVVLIDERPFERASEAAAEA
jgi:hypothetical protein